MRLYDAYQRLHARRRAMAQLDICATFYPGKRMMEIEDKDPANHLRLIGRVMPEPKSFRVNGVYWETRSTGSSYCYGWHTDPHGDVFRDGSGLCWGVVYQIPGRNHMARLVAGYEFGGCDELNITLDTTRIFEVRSHGARLDADETIEVARYADELARDAAEKELEYRREQEEDEQCS